MITESAIQPLKLYPRPFSGIALLIQALVTVIMALGGMVVFMFLSVEFPSPFFTLGKFASIIVLMLALYLVVLGIIRSIPPLNSLELDGAGFSYRRNLLRTRHNWSHCTGFEVYPIKIFGLTVKRYVVFNAKAGTPTGPFSKLLRLRCGHDFALPHCYKMKPRELVELMASHGATRAAKTWQSKPRATTSKAIAKTSLLGAISGQAPAAAQSIQPAQAFPATMPNAVPQAIQGNAGSLLNQI